MRGGSPLRGEVVISGAKNAVLVELASFLLASGHHCLQNVPDLSDVHAMIDVLKYLGCSVSWDQAACNVFVDTTKVELKAIPDHLFQSFRASILILGPLLARFGCAKITYPGGCPIGARPIDFHLKAFQTMGATVLAVGNELQIVAENGLRPSEIVFEYPSVGATENVLLAAVGTKGCSRLYNAALEPEVFDLIDLLKGMGADIQCQVPGTILVNGGNTLQSVTYRVLPDRLEAGTYLAAAAATGGDVTVLGIPADLLQVYIAKLKEMGHTICCTSDSIQLVATATPVAVSFTTMPYPGFPTDLQAPMSVLQTMAKGQSKIHESVFEKRLVHLQEFALAGAQVEIIGDRAIVTGKASTDLKPMALTAVDIRGAAGLVIAALAVPGESRVGGVEHIRRGYVGFEERLRSLGADISLVAA